METGTVIRPPLPWAILGIVLWWILFALIAFSVGTIPSIVRGSGINLASDLVWNSGWLIWCGLSFLAIRLARRYPLERKMLKRSVAHHFLLAFGVVLLHVAIEFSLNFPLRAWAGLPIPGRQQLASLFGYKFHINLVIYWGIVGATSAYDYYVRFRETEIASSQLEAKLAQSELHSLKMQLHPHFLFNTHHSIIALMLNGRNEEAIQMLTRLSDLLRVTLLQNKQQLTTLREELETLDLYLGIQKIRFQDRLEVESEVESEALDAEVPVLALQPIVENAIQHGIDKLTTRGFLRIRAQMIGSEVEITVYDNGPGIDESSGVADGNGIGLKTTRERFRQLYGASHFFGVAALAEGGTLATIRIPFRAKVSEESQSIE